MLMPLNGATAAQTLHHLHHHIDTGSNATLRQPHEQVIVEQEILIEQVKVAEMPS